MRVLNDGAKDSKSLLKEEILTQQEAADFFRITKNTLIEWSKKGIITPARIAGRVYYKVKDINLLVGEYVGGQV